MLLPMDPKVLRWMAIAMTALTVGLLIYMFAADEAPPKPIPQAPARPIPGSEVPTAHAVPCELVELRDISVPGRARSRAFIAVPPTDGKPTPLTADQRAQTALKAAVEIQRNRGADYVLVQLMFDRKAMSAGWAAEAEFAPDGFDQSGKTKLRNGVWEASVSATTPTADEVAIIRSWDEHAEYFRNSEGLLDERKLKAKIAAKTGFSQETITAARDRLTYAGKLEEYSPP
jgi:hypothetical protein